MKDLSKYLYKGYLPTIGIECHVQLNTTTKLFSGVSNDAREAEPNTLISHIDFGMPGALPVLNERAIELAVRAAFALNTVPQQFSKFDRKHYFYPDLPSGYQISQYDQPIIIGGHVTIAIDGDEQEIGITRAHLEADAGKSLHPEGADYSLVDLNRSGTPLLEIVSEPELHSAGEAKAFAEELYLAMKYAGVSDVDLNHGNMRFDVNVSVSKTRALGTRTETKNLNSFRSVEKAVEYEIKRQISLLEKNEKIVQETRGWDDARLKTFSQRSKEDAHDYRYFPDPDLPPIVLSKEFIGKIEATMAPSPGEYRNSFRQLKLDKSQVEVIINEPSLASFVATLLLEDATKTKIIANLLTGDIKRKVIDGEVTWNDVTHVTTSNWYELAALIIDAKISSTAAKEIASDMIRSNQSPLMIAKQTNLLQVSDEKELEALVESVLREHEKAAHDVVQGEMKAIGFLVGQVMKASQGKANPEIVKDLLRKKLEV
jgi:aspartyl-tRNA(Asn)/glutamyl-tRNA(Gln) amidotransferase subunit B